jgi:riboflavin synthase
MFTGIVEATGKVLDVTEKEGNREFLIESPVSHELKTDQSVSHNGVCLTIEEVNAGAHRVTAIQETLSKTELGKWVPGSIVNLERSMVLGQRLDGHIVQGHVDTISECIRKRIRPGSIELDFKLPEKFKGLVIEKGSIALNGISLTVFRVKKSSFRVAIIPYTYDHTNIRFIEPGDVVNLEFDIIGKYILRNQQ